ncbi:MAG: hypothetical protein ACOCX6_01415, partial [bacterium]
LKEITQRADKRIGLLTKEIGKKEKEAEVYTSLKPKAGLPPGEDARGGPEGDERRDGETTPKDAEQADSGMGTEGMPSRDRVIALYNNGISPDIICKELNITLAEVELIISLNRNRGAVG